jgi:hypothetical protein
LYVTIDVEGYRQGSLNAALKSAAAPNIQAADA